MCSQFTSPTAEELNEKKHNQQLLNAAKQGNLDRVKRLIANGTDPILITIMDGLLYIWLLNMAT